MAKFFFSPALRSLPAPSVGDKKTERKEQSEISFPVLFVPIEKKSPD